MIEYRKKLKQQTLFFGISVLLLTAVQVLSFMKIITPAVANERFASFWGGFIAGVAMGLTILFVVGMLLNLHALRKEAFLKRLFIKERDERSCRIAEKAKSTAVSVFLPAMLVAAIVSGFFSITVFFTLLACVLIFDLFLFGCKLYYQKQM